ALAARAFDGDPSRVRAVVGDLPRAAALGTGDPRLGVFDEVRRRVGVGTVAKALVTKGKCPGQGLKRPNIYSVGPWERITKGARLRQRLKVAGGRGAAVAGIAVTK